MELLLTCKDKSFTTDFLIDNFSKSEIYFNELKQADNQASLTIPYNLEIQNFINAYADEDIKATIKDGSSYVFSGYLRKNFTFSKKQRNQPIKLEIVSPSFLLDVDLKKRIFFEASTVGTVVDALLKDAGITTNTASYLKDSITMFIVEEGEKIKEVLNNLLFEYGYCYDFDNEGKFIAYPIFDIPEDFSDPVFNQYIFNGSNCLDEIKINKKEQKYDNVKIKWNGVSLKSGLIFADTTKGDAASGTCNIELPPKTYLGEGAESYYITYDSEYGEIKYVKSASLTVESSNNSGLQIKFENLGNKGSISIYNNSSSSILITKINVNGEFYCITGINETTINLGKNTKEYTAKYNNDKASIKKLSENYTNYLNYADYTISLKSKSDFNVGNFVKVIEDGLGTIYGRIIEKKTTIKSKVINYKIEAVSEYTKAVADTSKTDKAIVINKGEQGRSIVAVNEYYLTTDKGSDIKKEEVILKTPELLTPEKKYLWKCSETVLSDLSTLDKTDPVLIGVYGDTGATGKNGKDGAQGPRGEKGETGAAGKNGTNGKDGATGPQGPRGVAGPRGNTGATGERGGTYRGAFASAPSSPIYQDYYLNTKEGKIYYYSSNQWQPDAGYTTSWRYNLAMPDMIKLAGTINNPNITSAVNLWCKNLVAQKAFIDELAAKKIKLTTGGAIMGGDRYNEDGTIKDKSKNGFYFSTDGKMKGIFVGDNDVKQNIIIGANSGLKLLANSSSSLSCDNVIIGENSGKDITTGSGNVLINAEAGRNMTTGSNNICIGVNSGASLQKGRNNICIGPLSGQNLMNENNNIFIGVDENSSPYWDLNNSILIGVKDFKVGNTPNQVHIGNAFHYDGTTATVNNLKSERAGKSTSWIYGRNLATIKTNSYSGYDCITSMKTTNGSWEQGVYSGDIFYINYTPDANYNSGNNSVNQYYFKPNKSGEVAVKSDIPTFKLEGTTLTITL